MSSAAHRTAQCFKEATALTGGEVHDMMKTCRCVLLVQGVIQGGACGGVGVFVPAALQSEAPPLPV